MILMQLLCLSVAITMGSSVESKGRNLHRLVGGHLKIPNYTTNAELLETKSSGSKEVTLKKSISEANKKPNVDEEKKTLSQQVLDGKYGLIQKELFRKPLKKPGIISYDANPEVPKDTIDNLGGLTMKDIWLAENHLLVLKGGNYHLHDDKNDNNYQMWPAIDNYTSPKRPIKIPNNPKIPPPFPVQLTDEGPIQILGTNSSRTFDDPSSVFAIPPSGYVPGTGPFFPQYQNQADTSSRRTPIKHTSKTEENGERVFALSPIVNGSSPPLLPHFPQGMTVPPSLINDFDEDDPSIYYPPPYSFSYPSKDNSSLVPPGPLVPGIILPPPPNLFALLEHSTMKPTKRPSLLPKRQKTVTTTEKYAQIHPTTTPIHLNQVNDISFYGFLKTSSEKFIDKDKKLVPELTTTRITATVYSPRQTTKTKSSQPTTQLKRPSVTILKPVNTIETHKTFYDTKPEGIPFTQYGPPNITKELKIISSTQIPLSDSNNVNVNTGITNFEKNTIRSSDYYYYEPERNRNTFPTDFFNLHDKYIEPPKQEQPHNTHFIFVTSRPSSTQKPTVTNQQKNSDNSFRLHLGKLRKQLDYYTSPKPVFQEVHSPRPVYQYSFQAANYESRRQNDFKPSQLESSLDDHEGFKPLPEYSIQIQPNINIPSEQPLHRSPIHFEQNYRASTVKPPKSSNFQTTSKPLYAYEGKIQKKGRNLYKPQPIAQYSFETPAVNNEYKAFSVESENNYDDERTMRYTTFGQRIPIRTTPMPIIRYSTRSPKVVYITATNNIQEKPISLGRDNYINYVHQNSFINPYSELVAPRTHQSVKYPQVTKYISKPAQNYNSNFQQGFFEKPQIVDAIPVRVSDQDSQRGSFFSYSLPGDNGAHFYFLTPQLVSRKDQGTRSYSSRS